MADVQANQVVEESEVTAADAVSAEESALWTEMDAADKVKDSETKVDVKGEDSDATAKIEDSKVAAQEPPAKPAAKPAVTPAKNDAKAVAAEGESGKAKATAPAVARGFDDATLAAQPETVRTYLTRLETENRAHRGRQSRFDRDQSELTTLRAENEKLKVAKPADGKAPSADDVAEWKQFESDYPELAAAITKKFGGKIDTLEARLAEAEGTTTGIKTERTQAFVDAQVALVAEAHPTWIADIKSPDFKGWIKSAPKRHRDAFDRNFNAIVDAEETEWLLDEFKSQTGYAGAAAVADTPSNDGASGTKSVPLSAKRGRQLEGAAAPSPGAKTRVPQKGIPAQLESDEAMWNSWEQADKTRGVSQGL